MYFFPGVSDRAKSRLSRASSFDAESDPSSPARKPQGPATHQKKPETAHATNGNAAGAKIGTFFSTLDWQDESTGDNQQSQPSESNMGLLGNASEDEDDFSSFTKGRMTGNGADSSAPAGYENIGGERDNRASPSNGQKEEVVDLLNMGANSSADAAGVTQQMDLLNMGSDPSNVDLLSGHSSANSNNTQTTSAAAASGSQEPDLLGMAGSHDTFDPFQQFSSSGSQQTPKKPDLMTSNTPAAATEENDAFDPFLSFTATRAAAEPQPTNTSAEPQPSTNTDDDFFAFMESDNSSSKGGEPDLMKSWDVNSIKNFTGHTNRGSPNHTAHNLTPNVGGMHKSASTGSAMNFSGMASQAGRSSPQTGMSGMGQVPGADPFASFGMSTRISMPVFIIFAF